MGSAARDGGERLVVEHALARDEQLALLPPHVRAQALREALRGSSVPGAGRGRVSAQVRVVGLGALGQRSLPRATKRGDEHLLLDAKVPLELVREAPRERFPVGGRPSRRAPGHLAREDQGVVVIRR